MAKYILNIPDEIIKFMNGKFNFFIEPEVKVGECRYYKVRLDNTEITPYTEPNCKDIEQEVWEFASMLMNMHPDVAEDIYWSMNGGKGIGVAAEMTYQEAKSKYEEWKKQKDDNAIKQKVIELADEIGIHKLYAIVRDIRGE